jgi:Leucine-rich repeat (LRR) protein
MSIKLNTFFGLENLQVLDIYDNKLSKIEDNSFMCVKNLHELYLNNNEFEIINKLTFNGLTRLKILDLSECKIKLIDKNAFVNLEKLSTKIIFK